MNRLKPLRETQPTKSTTRFPISNFKELAYTPLWNVFLIVAGSALYALGAKAVVFQHNFITGGLFGAGMMVYYLSNILTPGYLVSAFQFAIDGTSLVLCQSQVLLL